jgi:hypothetical protein
MFRLLVQYNEQRSEGSILGEKIDSVKCLVPAVTDGAMMRLARTCVKNLSWYKVYSGIRGIEVSSRSLAFNLLC